MANISNDRFRKAFAIMDRMSDEELAAAFEKIGDTLRRGMNARSPKYPTEADVKRARMRRARGLSYDKAALGEA